MGEDVVAGDGRASLRGRHVAGQDAHGGRLAGAVRAEETEDFARLDRKLTSSTAVTRPYRFVRCWTSITTVLRNV